MNEFGGGNLFLFDDRAFIFENDILALITRQASLRMAEH
jgi:hypothetical protein